MNDPFAMRPFFGYNFGHYLQHWLDMNQEGRQMPKIFHVNWFKKNDQGKFIWPGFGENSRVLEWIIRRCGDEQIYKETPIGRVPADGSLNMNGLDGVDLNAVSWFFINNFFCEHPIKLKLFMDKLQVLQLRLKLWKFS